jgi:hypothetical protein
MGLLPSTCCSPGKKWDSGSIEQSQTLHPEAQEILDWIRGYTREVGLAEPAVISECRSASEQAELLRRWDAGDRAGIRARPGSTSWHIPDADGFCRAFDLGNTDTWLNLIGPMVVKKFPFARWGGNFLPKDEPHFELPKYTEVVIRLT